VLLACGGTEATAPRYPGTLRPPSAMGADVMMRQKLTARWGEGEEMSFDAVLQKQGDALVLLGLGPHGGRAFVIAQRGADVSYEELVDIDLPFPPEFILLDVQRVFFPRISETVLGDGSHARVVDGERVTERWQNGKLVSRTFERVDGDPAGTIRIGYGAGWAPGEQPPTVRFENGWFGYSLSVETLSFQRL
jgi:hypothetical protein